jgi:hypothetical protein
VDGIPVAVVTSIGVKVLAPFAGQIEKQNHEMVKKGKMAAK